MWAYPLRNAKKANKAKIPYDNHAKPLRKSKKNKKNKVFRRMQVGASHLALPHEILLFCSGDDVFKSYFEENVGPTGRGGHSYMLPPLVGPTSSPELKKLNLMRKCQM